MIKTATKEANLLNRYLSQEVNFGGELMTVADLYAWFQEHGRGDSKYRRRSAELWLIGYTRTTAPHMIGPVVNGVHAR